jgi:hypothetical protein
MSPSSSKDNRLPPPAFPPGARKHVRRNSVQPSVADGPPEAQDEGGLISPDDPFPARRDAVQRAFISPDDPLPHRSEPEGVDSAVDSALDSAVDPPSGRTWRIEDDGVVTGMGDDPHFAPDQLVSTTDPHVAELVDAVGKLAVALRRKGEAGLRTSPGMRPLEATLRSYCVGYLAGRRAEEDTRSDV